MLKKRGSVWWLDLWVGKHRLRRSLHTTERAVAIERARDLTVELRRPVPPGRPGGTTRPVSAGHVFGHYAPAPGLAGAGTIRGCLRAASGGGVRSSTPPPHIYRHRTALSVQAGPSSMLDNPVSVVVGRVAQVLGGVDDGRVGLRREVLAPARDRRELGVGPE